MLALSVRNGGETSCCTSAAISRAGVKTSPAWIGAAKLAAARTSTRLLTDLLPHNDRNSSIDPNRNFHFESWFRLAPTPSGVQTQSLSPDLSPKASQGTATGAFCLALVRKPRNWLLCRPSSQTLFPRPPYLVTEICSAPGGVSLLKIPSEPESKRLRGLPSNRCDEVDRDAI